MTAPGPEERRALVTGASSGIGAAFARALKSRGHKLILVARRRARLETLAEELGGEKAAAVLAADLSEPGAAAQLLADVRARGFAVELLVNSAGFGHSARFHEQSEERILGMIDVNVRALVALTRGVLPGMIARGSGTLINVASNAAFQPVPYLNVYAATKAFVLSFTEALSNELAGTGVRVQVLCPGLTATEFQEVAGTGHGMLASKLHRMPPAKVVAASLRGLEAGRLRVIAGLDNRLLASIEHFVPGAVARFAAARLFEPKG